MGVFGNQNFVLTGILSRYHPAIETIVMYIEKLLGRKAEER